VAQPNAEETGAALVAVQQAVEANAAARAALTDNLVAHVRALVEGFHAWYDDLAVRRLAKQISGLVQPAQRVMASQEDAYLAHIASTMAGHAVRPVGQVVVTDLRNGVDPEKVYERLAVQYRYEISKGETPDAAKGHVLTRADVMNQMDVTLAARAQAQKNVIEMPATGYRRVIHPELSQGGVCGLCIAAADRIYHKKALLPIHDRCKCGVLPIIGANDPGGSLNNIDLGTLYKNAGDSTSGANLKRTRYQVDEHGELGPVLLPKKRSGAGKGQGSAPKPEQSGIATQSADWLRNQINITEVLKDSPWRTQQLGRLRAELTRR